MIIPPPIPFSDRHRLSPIAAPNGRLSLGGAAAGIAGPPVYNAAVANHYGNPTSALRSSGRGIKTNGTIQRSLTLLNGSTSGGSNNGGRSSGHQHLPSLTELTMGDLVREK